MTITETINLTSEFLWDEDAPEILLNNLPSFNERTEDIVELTSYLDEYGTDKQKNYLPYFQSAIEFLEQNQRFPTLTELNEHCTSAPIPSRTETNVEDAYMVMGGDRIQEEHLVSELRSAIRSKDVGRIADFANSMLHSAPLPEINIDKILDIKAIRRKGRENYSPIITGIQVFDNLTYGFKNKTINTISAPSSGGKTTFAVNMAYNNAIKGNLVVYCALESSAEEILCSLISLAYKRKQKEDTSFLAEEFKPYKKIEGITGVYPGTVNSIKFYQLSEEIDNLLID
ncbi:MAG: DnaB-like helicase C-terminal domain-containing protein [Candidatus Gastranaerophilaceae bacterium]